MQQIGIVGLGHLGEIHLRQWLEIIPRENIYCFDNDSERLEAISSKYSVFKAADYSNLLSLVSIIDVVTPTQFHHFYAAEALKHGKHVFIEKPVCVNMQEVDDLMLLQKNAETLVQVGHVERYNPAFLAVKDKIKDPKFFEVHRLAPFVQRGTEVSVIMDLMIHDLDILLYLVDSPVKEISAKGVAILSQSPDIANVRIEFNNGCVANLTSSRISMKKMRKMRIFSSSGYTAIDFLEKTAEDFKIEDKGNGHGLAFTTNEGREKILVASSYNKLDKNAIFEELNDFFKNIISGETTTTIDLLSTSKTMKLALDIQGML
jgi:predicted dehydrogenase